MLLLDRLDLLGALNPCSPALRRISTSSAEAQDYRIKMAINLASLPAQQVAQISKDLEEVCYRNAFLLVVSVKSPLTHS